MIPSYFSGNSNCHSKRKKTSKNKMVWLEDSNFTTQVHKIYFQIAIYKLLHKVLWDYRFWKINKMKDRNWGITSQNKTKIANLNMGNPPEIFSSGIFLTSQIFGTSQYANSWEKIATIAAKVKKDICFTSQSKQVMNMHEICPNMAKSLPNSTCF